MSTKSGIRADQRREGYTITTAMVEEYLKKKFSALGGKLGNMNIMVKTMAVSKRFLPFILILPMEALDGNEKKQKNTQELGMFNPDTTEGSTVNLNDQVYKVIAPYTYNKSDEQAFFSSDWRRSRGVSASMSNKLKYSRRPHIQVFNKKTKHELTIITVMLDPLRLFHDMVTDVDSPNEQFHVNMEVDGVTKIKECEYEYKFTKDPIKCEKGKKGKNFDDIIAMGIMRSMHQ